MNKEELLAIIKPYHEYSPVINHVPIAYLKENIENWKKDFDYQDNPEFQRGHVWTRDQQIAYMESVLRTSNTNMKILINRHGLFNTEINPNFKYSGKYVVIDGLQRMTAILAFINGEYKLFNNQISYEDLKENKIIRGMSHNLEVHYFEMESEKEILEYYLRFNDGGTPHSKEEINRVRAMMESL